MKKTIFIFALISIVSLSLVIAETNTPSGGGGGGAAVPTITSGGGGGGSGEVVEPVSSGGGGGGGTAVPTVPSSGGGGGSGGVVEPVSSGGGGGGGSVCEKYYTCPDGTKVQYCFIHKFYNDDGELTGIGCGCKTPESLCETVSTSAGGGGAGEPVPIPSTGGGGGIGSNETPIICDGCILGDKCAPVSYRIEGKYCEIDSEFKEQKSAEESCENNFECKSNMCINKECISGGLLRRILNWFKKLFS